MLRLISGLAAALLMTGPVLAGELDSEFGGKNAPAPARINKNAPTSTNAALGKNANADKNTGSELDQESPTQAYRGWRGGWGGGYRWGGHRWGGYYGGGYRWGGYYGGYRPWGYGYGWRRPWYWGGPYVGLGIGYPYYSPYAYTISDYPDGVWYSYY